MTEIKTETIKTQSGDSNVVGSTDKYNQSGVTPNTLQATGPQTVGYLIYFLFGVLEILLAFRLILKLMGAGLGSAFVRGIYSTTGWFIMPFEGIFRRGFNQGLETTSVIEPSTIIALIVYAIVAWGIVKLISVLSRGE